MKTYDFDKIVNRRGSGAIKYDALKERYGNEELTPLWVADMDFETPDFIVETLKKRLEHPVFGYTSEPQEFWDSIINWNASHHNWSLKREWITYIPGIIKGIGMALNVFVKPDEKIIIQPPVYHPFRLVSQHNHREVVFNPLILNPDGSYSMDFENLAAVADEKCRMLILSNPHNPAGIMWNRETLTRLAEFCHERNIIVVSDEIHCDMALWGNRHIPFATVSEKAADCSITFASPSKTFNIAGIVSSYAVVPNDELRGKFYGWLNANELNATNIFSIIATTAAFSQGEEWRRQMLQYIEGNVNLLVEFFKENIPLIKPLVPQASFLVWLDCRALGLSHDGLNALFVEKAHLALNDGAMFGVEGEGFMRLNIALPREILKKALLQLKEAIKE